MYIVIIEPLPIVLFVLPYSKWNTTFFLFLLQALNCNMQAMTANRGLLYAGIIIIFTGDMFQMGPVSGKSVYDRQADGQTCDLYWKNAIRRVVYLENNHRFKNDPEWGQLLLRISRGEAEKKDWEDINSRWLNHEHMHLKEELKQFSDVSYACFTHKERCSIATAVFDDHVKKYCSTEKDIQPPMNTLIIEADIYKSNGSLHDNVIHSQLVRLCVDESVRTSNRDRVDPALKLS